MRAKLTHRLKYTYEDSVDLGEHRICLKPRGHGFQRLLDYNIDIEPKLYPRK